MQDSLLDAKIFELVQVQTTTKVGNLVCLGTIRNNYKFYLFNETPDQER
jgi:hypothetical protein